MSTFYGTDGFLAQPENQALETNKKKKIGKYVVSVFSYVLKTCLFSFYSTLYWSVSSKNTFHFDSTA